jgi:anti-sigma regulatory factor (Ser/Thr protein kinase)
VTDRPDLDVAATLRLPAFPESARRARKFLADFCSAAGLSEEVCHNAALLVSELVTNAVLHGRTTVTVEAHRPADTIRIAVRDEDPVLPAVGAEPVLDAESGRGLLIVSTLATRWGIEAAGSGKAIWFELDVDAAAESGR